MAWAQEGGRVSEAALIMPGPQVDTNREHPGKTAVKVQPEKKQRETARKSGKVARTKVEIGTGAVPLSTFENGAVPRSTFEDRTTHYFDPLSLTLSPEARIDPINRPYNPVQGSFTAADKGQIAVAPDEPSSRDISSAGIENLGQGHNVTVMVPLFKILNNLSPGPAQE
jgi:hypothetical protein